MWLVMPDELFICLLFGLSRSSAVCHAAGGRNRKVAEAYVRAFYSGAPKSFEDLEVSGFSNAAQSSVPPAAR